MKVFYYVLVFLFLFSSCVVVRQDEVAVKRRQGKLIGEPISQTARIYNPLVTTYIKVPTRIVNFKINLDIPSKEGLTIGSEMSILYRVKSSEVKDLLENVGMNYEQELIAPVFRSALADVSARFMAKDMHTGNRASIEEEVKNMINGTLDKKGIVIEQVLMKRIVLPESLSAAIEQKLTAEQRAQQMKFVLERERLENERKLIEAKGIAQANIVEAEGKAKANQELNKGLNELILRLRAIEAFEKLSKSPNAKVIITNGKTPFIVDDK
ncbi:SPFH domain / Band 7 family protein [Kordia sp. SMS9]|uniref:prohibitin family protein n=1 Tax=Kordia sp. SMS9 TaxID=2282170 RepID=UPI000E0D90D4|nr:prohibitin family protein [Kordia sp. SMS9]AXG70896.1 SPFH domain / Band 7 family protein [Kordia sp. SMS9]